MKNASDMKDSSGVAIRNFSDHQAETGLCDDFTEGYYHKPAVSEILPKNSYIVKNPNGDDTNYNR